MSVCVVCYMQPCFVAALLGSCDMWCVLWYIYIHMLHHMCRHCLQPCTDLVCRCPCPCFFGVSTAWILWYSCFLQSDYCCFVPSLCFANKVAYCSDSLSTVLVSCMCRQVPHHDVCGYSTSAKAWGVGDTSRSLLLTSCCAFAACACFQVTSCVLLNCCSASVSTCLAGPGVIFLRAGALHPGLFCFAASMSMHPARHVWWGHSLHASAHVQYCSESAQISSSYSIIMHICFTLHVYFSYIKEEVRGHACALHADLNTTPSLY
jgi:hypothetical protein